MLLDACSLASRNFDVLVSLLIDAFKIQSGFLKLSEFSWIILGQKIQWPVRGSLEKSRLDEKSNWKSRKVPQAWTNIFKIITKKMVWPCHQDPLSIKCLWMVLRKSSSMKLMDMLKVSRLQVCWWQCQHNTLSGTFRWSQLAMKWKLKHLIFVLLP